MFLPFLYNAVIWAFFQSVGSLPLFMLLLKIIVSGSLSCDANSLRKAGCSPSGPGDLFIFRFCNVFSTIPSFICNGCMSRSGIVSR